MSQVTPKDRLKEAVLSKNFVSACFGLVPFLSATLSIIAVPVTPFGMFRELAWYSHNVALKFIMYYYALLIILKVKFGFNRKFLVELISNGSFVYLVITHIMRKFAVYNFAWMLVVVITTIFHVTMQTAVLLSILSPSLLHKMENSLKYIMMHKKKYDRIATFFEVLTLFYTFCCIFYKLKCIILFIFVYQIIILRSTLHPNVEYWLQYFKKKSDTLFLRPGLPKWVHVSYNRVFEWMELLDIRKQAERQLSRGNLPVVPVQPVQPVATTQDQEDVLSGEEEESEYMKAVPESDSEDKCE
ncbi:hypothetical protein PCE1_003294 [Barthelona sp. PCE]